MCNLIDLGTFSLKLAKVLKSTVDCVICPRMKGVQVCETRPQGPFSILERITKQLLQKILVFRFRKI